MKTRKFCPHCGRPVLKSQIKGYAFQCFGCDEDFYRIEVFPKKDIKVVQNIRKSKIRREKENGNVIAHSFKKPYPRLKV